MPAQKTIPATCAPHSFFSALARKERMRRARCKKEKGRWARATFSASEHFTRGYRSWYMSGLKENSLVALPSALSAACGRRKSIHLLSSSELSCCLHSHRWQSAISRKKLSDYKPCSAEREWIHNKGIVPQTGKQVCTLSARVTIRQYKSCPRPAFFSFWYRARHRLSFLTRKKRKMVGRIAQGNTSER